MMLVLMQLRQTPQHACAAGAKSTTLLRTGRLLVVVRSSMVRVRVLPDPEAGRAIRTPRADTDPASAEITVIASPYEDGSSVR
jgi:hypothetical protein